MGPFLSLAALRRSLAKSSSRSKKQGVTHSVGSGDTVWEVWAVWAVWVVWVVCDTQCVTHRHITGELPSLRLNCHLTLFKVLNLILTVILKDKTY